MLGKLLEEEEAFADLNATKCEYFQKFPGMAQNKEEFAQRCSLDEEEVEEEDNDEGRGNRRKETETGADGESAAKKAREWGNFGDGEVDFDESMRGVSS